MAACASGSAKADVLDLVAKSGTVTYSKLMTHSFQVPTPAGPYGFEILAGSSVIFVGANGGGKTRLAVQIEQSNLENVHRISAHRSLALNPAAPKISERLAKKGLKYGYASEKSGVQNKGGQRWGNQKWATHLLNDFDFVIQALFAEQSNTAGHPQKPLAFEATI